MYAIDNSVKASHLGFNQNKKWNESHLESLDLEVDPVDVADDGTVRHRGKAAVPVVGASEGLRLFHVFVADVVVERGDLGGGVRAAVALELLF